MSRHVPHCPRPVFEYLETLTSRHAPDECVAAVFDAASEGDDPEVHAFVNRAVRPDSAFVVDPLDFLNAATAQAAGGRRLRAWYHSHPHGPGQPSAADLALAWAGCEIWIGAGAAAFELRAFTVLGEELWRLDARSFATAAAAGEPASSRT